MQDVSATTGAAGKREPTLKLKFLSHGTLESKDLDFTRRFYEEFFGFQVVRPSKVSIWCRLAEITSTSLCRCLRNARGNAVP